MVQAGLVGLAELVRERGADFLSGSYFSGELEFWVYFQGYVKIEGFEF